MRAFTILGFVQEPENLLKRRLSERLGIVPRTIDFRNAGQFYLYTSYGDVAETEQAIALKLGFARSKTKSPLSAQQLLRQKIVTPEGIDHGAVRGNTLLACFSKAEAKFVAFKNLVSMPQLYYWMSGNELIASDNLACLINLLDRVELNEEILPFHFVFRHAPGTMTYIRNVKRLFPGQVLHWREGNVDIRRVQDLRFANDELAFERVDSRSVGIVYQELTDVVGAYIDDVDTSGNGVGNLLSGGVDSSVLQLTINEHVAQATTARSFSSVPLDTPSFEFEIEYAREASELLKTEHTFIEFKPEDYPDLVIKAVETLGQPVLSDVEPCKLAIAQYLLREEADRRYFFVGQGADTLFGLGITQRLKMLDLLRRIRGSSLALKVAGGLLKPFTANGLTMLKGSEILAHPNDPDLLVAPINTIAVYSNLDIARRSFGDETLHRVLEYRRNWEIQYLNSENYTEKVHVIDLLCDSYEIQVQSGQLFLSNGKEQIYPYMDEDIVRISFAFRPELRYIQGWRTKPLMKDILEQQGLSAIARRRKGGSVFTDDLYSWMRSGPLHEMVRDIKRPDFLSKADFENLLKTPDHTLWSLLTFDIFQRKILRHKVTN